jgi:uncharacterized protein (TIGR02001 family)
MIHAQRKPLVKSLALVLLAAAPLMASAQFSGNLSLTSHYKFRGQDQDASQDKGFKPALQGGFDYAFANGLYLGNWNSSVNWLSGNSLEMDVYAGHKGELAAGLGYDVGVLAYVYPGNSTGNTTEVYAGLSYGPLSAKYSHTVSSDYFAYGSKAGYISLGYAQPLLEGLTFKAAVGATRFKSSTVSDFTDYSIGLSYDLAQGLALSAAYVGASKKASYGFANDNRVVLTLSKSL